MKKLIAIAAGILFSAGIVCAQDAQTKKADPATTQTSQKAKCDMKNCVMMKSGKMVMMKDGKEMPMTDDVAMANGTKVSKNGTITMKDGKTSKMKNDECMDMNGTKGKAPKSKAPAPAK